MFCFAYLNLFIFINTSNVNYNESLTHPIRGKHRCLERLIGVVSPSPHLNMGIESIYTSAAAAWENRIGLM